MVSATRKANVTSSFLLPTRAWRAPSDRLRGAALVLRLAPSVTRGSPDSEFRTFGSAIMLTLMADWAMLAACSSGQGSSNTSAPGPHPVPGAKHYPPQVALFGDSLAWKAQPYGTVLIHEDKEATLTFETFGGTATCDWIRRMREVESQYHPRAVELEFSGNNLTACMKGYELYTKVYYDKYRADTLTAISIFAAGGAYV